ncbi:TonB-dependent receptor [Litoribacter ruber]|uniref:TonB-dependent receptor n=1 Tax=Litoribacter ruber TaxID=702568 RepID=UPI001FEAB799|nr:TonB-dependent receptor [Litoribacter ruber]
MKRFVFAVSFLMIFANGFAMDLGRLSGRVIDGETSSPLPGVTVYLPELNRGTVTDGKGHFEIEDIPAKTLTLQLSFMGYETKILKVDTKEVKSFDFSLVPSATTIDEVVVSGAHILSREKSPVVISKVDRAEILRNPSPSLMSTLARTPGVSEVSMGPGISKPVIRGMSFSRVLTVYQGGRFENQQWGADHGLGLSETGIESVELVKGPASLIYGSGAMAGVVNLIEERDAERGTVSGDVNLRGYSNSLGGRLDAGVRGASQNGFVWSLRAAEENHADYLAGSGETVGNTRFNTRNVKAGVGWSGKWGDTRVRYTYLKQNLGILEEDEREELVTFRNDRAMQLPFQDVTDHFLSSETNLYIGQDRLKLTFGYHLNFREEIEDGFDEVDLGLRQQNFMYDAKYFKGLGKDLELIVGVQGFYLQNQNYDHAEEILIPDATKDDRSLYALLNYAREKWVLQGGARYDYRRVMADARDEKFLDYGFELPGSPNNRIIERDFGGMTASGGATFMPDERWRFRANLASGFRAPDLAELFSNGPHPGTSRFELGNSTFEREQNVQADLGIRYKLSELSMGAEFFYNHVDNFIFFTPTDGRQGDLTVWEFEQDNARLYGGEFYLDYHPTVLKGLSIQNNYSMVIGQRRSSGEYLPYIPAFRWQQELTYNSSLSAGHFSRPFASLRGNWVMNQNREAPLEQSTPGYYLLGLSLGSQVNAFGQTFDLYVNGTNLLNLHYLDHMSLYRPFGIPQMGRNVSVHLRFKF